MKTQKQEFLEMLSAYQGIIHKVNLIYFPVPEDREDNFQEVVLGMWNAYPRLENKEKIASWIYAIAINTSVSKIRKDSRYVFSDRMESQGRQTTTEKIEDTLDFQHLLDAIRGLKEIDRSIMLLYLEDYSYHEIAEITGINSSNVGARIHRAKTQLEKRLKLK